MNLAPLDWGIVALILATMVGGVVLSRRGMRSVSDYLAAGRSAGRYLVSVSQGIAALGAITIVGLFEMNYVAGFAMTWWGFTMGVVILLITVSGWVIYRFRQTRSLTLAEFFERRYSRRFRIFAGLLAFVSGVINFGIFPAVGARFFLHFCGLPTEIAVAGFALPTFPLLMAILLGIALYFVFAGGQVAIIMTDFLQGIFANVAFLLIIGYLMLEVDWSQIFTALQGAPETASLINPFKTRHVEDFNLGYFLIGVAGVIYGTMSWQGTQAYNASARSAHEAKMGQALSNWRGLPQTLFLLFVPIVAYTVLHHPDFAPLAQNVETGLAAVGNEAVQSQVRTPLVLVQLLPVGLMGAFAAVMLACFVSTHDTYLHSWGSIFIQDVIMPFRRRPLSRRQHLRLLRLAVLGVALFIFVFSLLFRQSQYIFLFFAITGAIFAGGSGAVIIGGLYWKRGTTAAAWSAMITGSAIAVGGIVVHQIDPDFPINGQMFWGIAMAAASLVYVAVSLLGRATQCDLDALLHRTPPDASPGPPESFAGASPPPAAARGWKALGMGAEFSRGDRILYVATYSWTLVWTLIFIVGTIYNLSHEVADDRWARFWRFYVWVQLGVSALVVIWFAIGGGRDITAMMRRLRTMQRDDRDDGRVRRGAGERPDAREEEA
ncbi:MAG: sodium:solute symporter [Candidatus Eisenbacteria bacterium]|nr:sodium:solute symporter [Candidatus Eisenbacteria bacterium]